MTHGKFSHYYLMPDGELEMKPAATQEPCIPYIVQQGDRDSLCVMEGDAFHSFDIGIMGLARLAEESAAALRKRLMGRK